MKLQLVVVSATAALALAKPQLGNGGINNGGGCVMCPQVIPRCPPSCPAGQICLFRGQSCQTCAAAECQPYNPIPPGWGPPPGLDLTDIVPAPTATATSASSSATATPTTTTSSSASAPSSTAALAPTPTGTAPAGAVQTPSAAGMEAQVGSGLVVAVAGVVAALAI